MPGPATYAERIEEAFANFIPAAPVTPVPLATFLDQLTVYPCSDPHFGMFAWKGDAGKNWDLKLAVASVRHLHQPDRQVSAHPQGDPADRRRLLHANNQAERTRSDHQLDVDGRFPKVVDTAAEPRLGT